MLEKKPEGSGEEIKGQISHTSLIGKVKASNLVYVSLIKILSKPQPHTVKPGILLQNYARCCYCLRDFRKDISLPFVIK